MRHRSPLLIAILVAALLTSCGKPNPLGPDQPGPINSLCSLQEYSSPQFLGTDEFVFGSPGAVATVYPNVTADSDSNVFDSVVSITYIGADGNTPPPIAGWAQNLDDPDRRVPAFWGDGPTFEPAFYFPNANGTYSQRMRIILPPGRYKVLLSWTNRSSSISTAEQASRTNPNQILWHPEGSIEAWLHRWRRVCP